MADITDDIAYLFLYLRRIDLKENNEFVEKFFGVEYLIDLWGSADADIRNNPANFSFNRSSGVI